MHTAKRSVQTKPSEPADVAELKDSVRVLAEVIRHLAERVELLETRDTLRRLRPVEG